MSSVAVIVRAGAVVYVGDHSHGPGETLAVATAEAKALAEQGLVERAPSSGKS